LKEHKLAALGADFVEEQLQQDRYFDDDAGNFAQSDRCLRLRCQRSGQAAKVFLTYKGPKGQGRFKERSEIEVELADADSAAALLGALGYRKKLVVEKKRRLWRLGTCHVALDFLPALGTFVEIEGPDEQSVADVQARLGLAESPHIVQSYAELIKETSQM